MEMWHKKMQGRHCQTLFFFRQIGFAIIYNVLVDRNCRVMHGKVTHLKGFQVHLFVFSNLYPWPIFNATKREVSVTIIPSKKN